MMPYEMYTSGTASERHDKLRMARRATAELSLGRVRWLVAERTLRTRTWREEHGGEEHGGRGLACQHRELLTRTERPSTEGRWL